LSLFLATFFLLYGLLHLYAFLKTRSALSLRAKAEVPIIAFMALMLFSPLLVHYFEDIGLELIARIMSYTGYIWMGLLFLFISVSLFIDIYRLLIYVTGLILKTDLSPAAPSAKPSFFIPVLLAFAVSIYGYFEANNVLIENVHVKTSKIPKEMNRLRIVQISDVHLGLIVRKKRLRKIVEKIEDAKPDILVSTGDLVDGQINELKGLAELLREIKPRYGKFAITGNHEFYAGLDQATDFIKKAGFTILRGKSVDIAGIINITGIDDRAGKQFGLFKGSSEKGLLSGHGRDKFSLLLKHRPLVDKDSPGFFDLQLSGHTHKGQIFPFVLLTRLFYPRVGGYSELSGGSRIYVSRGTGTWGPPIRFLSPPEVTVIDLVGEEL
jgi:predicted MPP superfamily phosphohydrolase